MSKRGQTKLLFSAVICLFMFIHVYSCSHDARGLFVPFIPAVKICLLHEVQNNPGELLTTGFTQSCYSITYLRDRPTNAHI
jgi:hypothetical protein